MSLLQIADQSLDVQHAITNVETILDRIQTKQNCIQNSKDTFLQQKAIANQQFAGQLESFIKGSTKVKKAHSDNN